MKIWSTSLAKWVLENPKRGKVLIGSMIFVTEGILFALLEFSFLVSMFFNISSVCVLRNLNVRNVQYAANLLLYKKTE